MFVTSNGTATQANTHTHTLTDSLTHSLTHTFSCIQARQAKKARGGKKKKKKEHRLNVRTAEKKKAVKKGKDPFNDFVIECSDPTIVQIDIAQIEVGGSPVAQWCIGARVDC